MSRQIKTALTIVGLQVAFVWGLLRVVAGTLILAGEVVQTSGPDPWLAALVGAVVVVCASSLYMSRFISADTNPASAHKQGSCESRRVRITRNGLALVLLLAVAALLSQPRMDTEPKYRVEISKRGEP